MRDVSIMFVIPEILTSMQLPLVNGHTYLDDSDVDAVLTSIGKETNFCSVILRYERSVKHTQQIIVSYHARIEKSVNWL
jgi:hypothetical protein